MIATISRRWGTIDQGAAAVSRHRDQAGARALDSGGSPLRQLVDTETLIKGITGVFVKKGWGDNVIVGTRVAVSSNGISVTVGVNVDWDSEDGNCCGAFCVKRTLTV